MTVTRSVLYGTTRIPYRLTYSRRRTLQIAVHPDGEVEVSAPMDAEEGVVAAKVKKRAGWILRQRNFFDQFSPRTPPRQHLSGETHLYLGRQYRLKAVLGGDDQVVLSRGLIRVSCKATASESPPDPEQIAGLLGRWYREKAGELFHSLLDEMWARFSGKGMAPRLQIKRMRTRWGSLSKRGTLTLNPDLIRAPKECIVYVICHELCHLRHHDHGRSFYKLLGERMPDWEARKMKLEKTMV